MFMSREQLESSSRIAARSCQWGADKMLCSVLGRYKIAVPVMDLTMTPHLIFDGFWESWVTLAMSRVVRKGDVVAVVGANIGYYAVMFADLVGDSGHVRAFEADPKLASLCDENLFINGFSNRSTVVNVAIASKSGKVKFMRPRPTAIGIGRILPDDADAEEVDATTLDEAMAGSFPDVVFTDAEGSDGSILASSPNCRKSAGDWVLEWFPPNDKSPIQAAMMDGFKLNMVQFDGSIAPTSLDGIGSQAIQTVHLRR